MQTRETKYYYDSNSSLLFMKDSKSDIFFPFLYDYDPITNQGKIFLENPLYKALFNYVEFVRRRVDKRTGQMFSIPLFVYQWVGLFIMVNATLKGKAENFLMAWARQSGKSEIIKLFCGFAVVYLADYMDIPLERFYLVLGSYKEEAVKKLSVEVKPYIYKAIEHYNDTHVDQLVYKKHEPSLTDDYFTLQINKIFFGEKKSIPYSLYKAITCGSTQDGLSAHALVVDEAGLIESSLFETSVAPFTTTTGGCQFIYGVPNSQAESLFIMKYNSREVQKVIFDWEKIYNLRKLTNNKLADTYYTSCTSKIKEKGKNSPFIQWNYYLNPYHASGKFINEKLLNGLNILVNTHTVGDNFPPSTNKQNVFNVAGFDTSVKHDYKALTIGTATITENNYITEVKAMYTFNKYGKRMSVETLADQVVQKCIQYKVDVFCFDSTSHGLSFIQMFIKFMRKYNVVISLCPYSYTGLTKSRLFNALEESVYEQRIKLLKKNETWESEKLVEELLYLERKVSKSNNSIVNYSAPNMEECSDDHANSLALFNIGLKELIERINSHDNRRKEFDDGINHFKLYLTKFKKTMNNTESIKEKQYRLEKELSEMELYSWCEVL